MAAVIDEVRPVTEDDSTALGNAQPPEFAPDTGISAISNPDDLLSQDDRRKEKANVGSLVSYLQGIWDQNLNYKRDANIEDELLAELRQRDSLYDANIMAAIAQQGGSDIFMGITAVKCRAAESWLNDIFSTVNGPQWHLQPTPIASLPDNAKRYGVATVMGAWQRAVAQTGAFPDPVEVYKAASSVRDNIFRTLQKDAEKRADRMEKKIQDQLDEGGWYDGFQDFVSDVVTMKCGVLKGPIIQRKTRLSWELSKIGVTIPTVKYDTIPTYQRVSPFDIYPSPGATECDEGDFIERMRFTRKALQKMKGIPGYDDDAISRVIERYGRTGYNTQQYMDSERMLLEDKGQRTEQLRYIEALEFWCSVEGKTLIEQNCKELDGTTIEEDTEYEINAIVIADELIYLRMNPDPLGQRPYCKTGWAKVPGSFWYNGVPDLMRDLQKICNASIRAMVDNMGVSSGPQVGIMDNTRIPAGEDLTNVYPRKIWQFVNPRNSQADPIKFFDIPSHAAELVGVYEKFAQMADDFTGIPAYSYGSDKVAGAGRTSSGLNMLMQSAARGIKLVIARITSEVLVPMFTRQYNWNMLYDDDVMCKGDAQIMPVGVLAVIMRDQLSMAKQNFLTAANNPVDNNIINLQGRAAVWRDQAKALDMDPADIVRTDEELAAAQMQQAQMAQAAMQGPQGLKPGMAPGAPQPVPPQKPMPTRGVQQRVVGPPKIGMNRQLGPVVKQQARGNVPAPAVR